MPPKSTYFFPKIPTGLVFNPLECREDLHAQGRRRHHRPLVRRPRRRSPPAGPRPTDRSTRRRRRSASPASPPTSPASSTTTSSGSRTSSSSPAPSWRPRPRRPSGSSPGVSKVTQEMVERLEADIDRYMDRVDLPPKFVIPGGTELSARLDVARAAVRRAERRVVELKRGRRPRRRHRPALPEPALGRRLRDGALRRRARPRAVRRKRMRATARRENGTLQARRRDPRPSLDRGRRARGRRRRRRRADPAGAARREPRLLHRDHDRDVRRAQGLGHRRRGRRRRLRARPARLADQFEMDREASPRSCPRSSASG